MNYQDFLTSKEKLASFQGAHASFMPDGIFDYQQAIVQWALRRGRACIFAGTGLGKTIMELVWAQNIVGQTNLPVLVLSPLAVADQIVSEAERFGIVAAKASCAKDVDGPGIYVTNYQKLERFYPNGWGGLVLDESSIIKHHDGSTKETLIDFANSIMFRLASTATPAPNDWMELASHAEFLGVCSRAEMLSTYFVHDGGETQKWRLKGHASQSFWKWVCSWACLVQSPSDIGFDGSKHVLPALKKHMRVVDAGKAMPGELFAIEAQTLQERLIAKRQTITERVSEAAKVIANDPSGSWVIWCHLNSESSALADAIPESVEIRGDQTEEQKETILKDFASGKIKRLIAKPSMCGFGLNWQHCNKMIFVGLNDSWEQVYQAIRRCWRFGQKNNVDVYFVAADVEGNVVANIEKKDSQAAVMAREMISQSQVFVMEALNNRKDRLMSDYKESIQTGDGWEMHLGDCVEGVSRIESNSIDFSIYSPPFSSLYTYSASMRDMGNTKDDSEFLEHYRFLVRQIMRVTKPGRLTAFHCMLLSSTKAHHGYIGRRDFRGELIRIHVEEGWIYHSEVCIWKDPVTAMQRTKALGLLYKQLKKDSSMSCQGIPDYLVVCRKPGINAEPIGHDAKDFPVAEWQKIASPVWMDINQSETLQRTSARADDDEKHICPLQLEVILRALRLYTNPEDLVMSPFAGIGSEGYVSLKNNRRFVGFELKESYFAQACSNLKKACRQQSDLFSHAIQEG